MKILPNKITRRNRNTQSRVLYCNALQFSMNFRVANKGSKIFIDAQAMADVRRMDEITLNDGADLNTFAAAEILFDEPKIN
ncbi:hypothetical protein ACPUER_04090 [Burkholderia sp. DN3021]|uniref:hypothetical protein n=1 Tax=Burkholderia sp. DN3021 TaxID=3410137 RepID=UPI003C7DD3FC